MRTDPYRTPCLLLDMDGVLVDTTGLQDATLNRALEWLGYKQRWEAALGEEALSSVAKLTQLGIPSAEHQRIKDAKLRFFKENTHLIKYDPQLAVWLGRAKAMYPGGVGLVTSMRSEMLFATFGRVGLSWKTFDGIVCQEEVGPDFVKPDPAPYLLGAAKLRVHPRDCTVYEDSEAGVASATAAKCGAVRRVSYEEFTRRLKECEF